MSQPWHVSWLVVVGLYVGCSSAANPSRLYLAPNGDELHVRLQPIEPNPFWAPGLGAGGTLEAQFTLEAPLRAGVWHFVGDGVIVGACDVTVDVLWRDVAGDHPIASWSHHFDPPTSGFAAQPFEADASGVAAPNARGETLVLRFTVQSTEAIAYIPNGDGAKANGRIPEVTLPP